MPNWCANNLTIEHEDSDMVDRFVKAYNEGNTCNEFIPKPENLGDGWWDWCINNWGIKWDIGCENDQAHGLKPTRVGNQVTVTFDSAWAPPLGLYKELDKLGFMVNATYFEPGMAFCGIWHDGDDLYTEYGDDKNLIPVQIWEDYNLSEFFEEEPA
jgi:hypothetical protein